MPYDQSIFSWHRAYDQYHGQDSFSHIASNSPSTLLTGLRLGVKDLFHIAGLPTGAGNPDWLRTHLLPTQTSPIVQALMRAGADLIGKTQTDELAYSLNGLNIHYGAPRNPKWPRRLPGGSTSGSAVAVAMGEIDIGLGTDTGGSIRVPASYNGLFGIRTSHGLLSREQMVPLAPSFDTVGWLTRDATTLQHVGDLLLPPPAVVFGGGYNPVNVGVITAAVSHLPSRFSESELWTSHHQQWLRHQPRLVQRKTIRLDEAWFQRASQCFRVLQGRDIWREHGEWITAAQPRFAPDIHARFEWASQLTEADEAFANAERQALCAEITAWFDGVDVLLLPTTPGAAPLLGATAEWMDAYRRQLMGLTAPAGLAGLPQVHLPVLASPELDPDEWQGAVMGVSLLAPALCDSALLRLAASLDYSFSPDYGRVAESVLS